MNREMIQQLKLTPKDLKPKFENRKKENKIMDFVNLTRDRVREGRRQNLVDWRMWWAMDTAYDVPFKQTTYSHLTTFMERVIRTDMSSEDVLKAAKEWGLTMFIRETVNDGKKCNTIDLPVFFKIFIPLVRAYVNIRWAKLFNDRNVFPLLKYEPLKNTEINRARCEIITDVVETIGQQLGYRPVLRQWILNMLLYGTAVMFPIEDWYRERGMKIGDGDEPEIYVKKQGLRYALPHPSRVFYDQMHRIGTANYDAGCAYAGYWYIVRYRDVMNVKPYWNKDNISMMDHDLIRNNNIFFQTIYPCQMEFVTYGNRGTTGAGELDRESNASFYTAAHEDKAVVLSNLFQKLNPYTTGLTSDKNADFPMWFRCVIANDVDIVYMAPLGYCPVLYMGYDAHEERRRNCSLSMEILPFQDHMSNLLSQQILTAKQNLLRVSFVNEDLVPTEYLDKMMNYGEDLYRSHIFIPYKGRLTAMAQNDVRMAFTSINFPQASTVEIMGAFRLLLDTLERVLVFSAQEVGAIAAHEQTAEETRIIAGSVNNRVALTDSFIEDAIYAWKKQQYDALMAYGNDDIETQIDMLYPITTEVIKDLGFTIDKAGIGGVTKAQLKGPKKKLQMEGFVSAREGESRINNPEVASSMAQIMSMLMSNEITALAIGPDQVIKTFNMIGRLAGLPRDFQLHVANRQLVEKLQGGGGGEGQGQPVTREEVAKAFEDLTAEILKQTNDKTAQAIQQVVAPLSEAVKQNSSGIKTLQQGVEQLMSRLQTLAQAASQRASGSIPTGQQ